MSTQYFPLPAKQNPAGGWYADIDDSWYTDNNINTVYFHYDGQGNCHAIAEVTDTAIISGPPNTTTGTRAGGGTIAPPTSIIPDGLSDDLTTALQNDINNIENPPTPPVAPDPPKGVANG